MRKNEVIWNGDDNGCKQVLLGDGKNVGEMKVCMWKAEEYVTWVRRKVRTGRSVPYHEVGLYAIS